MHVFGSNMGKKIDKTLDVFEKAYQLATSKETKKLAKATLKFVRDSGIGERALNYTNKKVGKKTKHNPRLDRLRNVLYNIAKDDLVSKREDKTLQDALLDFSRKTGTGKRGVKFVSKEIAKHTKKHPLYDYLRNVGYQEASNYFEETPNRREPGVYAANSIFGLPDLLMPHIAPQNHANGRSPSSASTTPKR